MSEAVLPTPAAPTLPAVSRPSFIAPSPDALLHEAILDAQRLVRYASANGSDLEPDTTKTVVEAQSLLSQSQLDPATYDAQEKFWASFAKLAKLVQPATVESLENEVPGPPSLSARLIAFLWRRPPPATGPSVSERAVWNASWFAIAGLLVVMAFQSIFEVGNSTLIAYQDAQKVVAQRDQVIGQADEVLDSAQAAGKTEADMKALKKTRDDADLERTIALNSISRRLDLVRTVMFWKDWDKVLSQIDDDFDKAQAIVAQLEGMLLFLREALLPVLWGFLGASLYVVRALAEDVRTTSYGLHRKIVFRSRYTMGMVAGFVIAKFFPTSIGIQNEAVPRWPVQIPPPVASRIPPGRTGWIMSRGWYWRPVAKPLP